jgi:hypothetical protein
MPVAKTITVKCEAARGMPSGVVNYFLEIIPSIPPKAEYILMMARDEALDLQRGASYLVTFEGIDG